MSSLKADAAIDNRQNNPNGSIGTYILYYTMIWFNLQLSLRQDIFVQTLMETRYICADLDGKPFHQTNQCYAPQMSKLGDNLLSI